MELLNRIVSYWYDCIKNEDVLEKDISINVKNKAVLYPFDKDLFIFNNKEEALLISDNDKLMKFAEYVRLQNYEVYYGYPILFYLDDNSKKYLIAPLFIIKLLLIEEEGGLFLIRGEQSPVCGVQAFTRLGLRNEQIADISESLTMLFNNNYKSSNDLVNQCLKVIQEEIEMPINEPIEPNKLTNSYMLSKSSKLGIYNKSLIFAGENSYYNIHLLQDLLELKERYDLHTTALSYLLETYPLVKGIDKVPILPFPLNEYQIRALQDVFNNKLTVITGPPGTGKSQFISNLIINLFLDGKSILFVSHTNEAVDIVNKKINEHFRNLLLRTGKKEFRQELKGKFNELLLESQRNIYNNEINEKINSLWTNIILHRKKLIELNGLERKIENFNELYNNEIKSIIKLNLFSKLIFFIKRCLLYLKILKLKHKLYKYPTKKEIEQEVRRLEKDFYRCSEEYVKNIYMSKIFGSNKNIGKVKFFLDQVYSKQLNEEDIDKQLFKNVLDILRVWSSTLKSIRRTFPLSPGIFDYVIFDEASQVDLPSAAPALYRAKRAIIVGDPMQLTHIAGITLQMDRSIAKIYRLLEERNVYPSKIRYCDISLYKSAENSLNHRPILLINHYRSEDQIITLCNKVFYKGSLKIMTNLDYSKFPSTLPLGVCWINCQGEVVKHPSGSRINVIEVEVVSQLFNEILQKISETNLEIGIVTPYSKQQDAIYEKISKAHPEKIFEKHNVKILTAHKFQGSEKDIIIFSLVLASKGNGNSDRWYNLYPQILNVALSRAKYLLYIVGDKKFCYSRKGILKQLVETYDEIKKQEQIEKYTLHEKFDSPTERFLFQKLQEIDFEQLGYKLIPKLVVKRYTLDFAIIGPKKINIECDGCQHELVEGIPVIEDIERDEFLKKEGWEIIRFPNHKILCQTNMVINKILEALS